MIRYTTGMPCRVAVRSPDRSASMTFYTDIFGWTATVPPEGFIEFRIGNMLVAWAGDQTDSFGMTFQVAWYPYFYVEDVAATFATAVGAGAEVMAGPTPVRGLGRGAIVTDPNGATLCLWEPGALAGAELVNASGAMRWHELLSADTDTSRSFYSRVFGWECAPCPEGESHCSVWRLGGRIVGGMRRTGGTGRSTTVPRWLVYFGVDDCDGAAKRARHLGGEVLTPPIETPGGRRAVLSDPHGATFGVIATGARRI